MACGDNVTPSRIASQIRSDKLATGYCSELPAKKSGLFSPSIPPSSVVNHNPPKISIPSNWLCFVAFLAPPAPTLGFTSHWSLFSRHSQRLRATRHSSGGAWWARVVQCPGLPVPFRASLGCLILSGPRLSACQLLAWPALRCPVLDPRIGIYTKFQKRKLFQEKWLSSNSAQMNRVSHDNIVIFSDGYNAVFSGFFFG